MNAPVVVRPGWQAKLRLTYGKRGDRTRITASQRSGPLAFQRAFYPENSLCHTYLLHPPGGVVGGDTLDLDVSVESSAETLITTPGATKFYRSMGPVSTVRQQLKVAADASFEWMPQENIFFPDTLTRIDTRIDLEAGSRFIGWEINCLGRPANQERFHSGSIFNQISVYRAGEPLLFDRFQTRGLDQVDSPTGMRGHSAQATLIATLDKDEPGEQVAALCARIEAGKEQLILGATLMDGLLVVRALGEQSQTILAAFCEIWALIRPQILNRAACPPRIWAT